MNISSSPHPVLAVTDLMSLKTRCMWVNTWDEMRCPCCGGALGVGLVMDDNSVFDLCLVCFAVVEVESDET